jgi:TatD DNase family protein
MANLIDIGVNLMSPAFDRDREAVLARAEAAGVKPIIITGSDLESTRKAAEYAERNAACKATAGLHPHNAKNWDSVTRENLRELILRKPLDIIAALGECGLDYNRNFSPPNAQRKCFEDQLALAAELGKPVFLHERDAFNDFFSILKQFRPGLPGAVVHCFTGGAEELEAYLALNCYIGITGWLCDERRGGNLIPLLRKIPANRLLLETDAPYLLPRRTEGTRLPSAAQGKSGRNEPCFLPHIAAFTAEITGKTVQQIAEETSKNAARLFKLPLQP